MGTCLLATSESLLLIGAGLWMALRHYSPDALCWLLVQDWTLAIARQARRAQWIYVHGPLSWQLSPENHLCLYPDVLRVHLWRISGSDGREFGFLSCPRLSLNLLQSSPP